MPAWRDPELRFREKITVAPNGCWVWIGARASSGEYGSFRVNGRSVGAHRWSYEQYVRPIPDGYQIDHLCRNRRCVNPLHLEAVTQQENNRRSLSISAMNRRKTHCKRGHPFDLLNTYIDKHGDRMCRACLAMHQAAYEKRRPPRPRRGSSRSQAALAN